MSLFIIVACITLLILLITWAKLNPFVAFLIVSLLAGWLLGIPLETLTKSVKKGIGDMLGELFIVIGLGAMLGKLVAESGAAQKIATVLVTGFGKKNVRWAMVLTGFIAGIPLFYNVGFVLLIPLVFSVAYQTRLSALYVGVPLIAALSVTHGFLPPHPSPTALVAQLHASMGTTLLYGLVIAVPVVIIAGPFFASTLKQIKLAPLQLFEAKELPAERLPGFANSLISALLPVFFLTASTLLPLLGTENSSLQPVLSFISDPAIVMLLSLLVAIFTLGLNGGHSLKNIMSYFNEAIKDISLIFLIVAGAGALKQILIDSGVSNEIGALLKSWPLHPLLLGWIIAAVIRLCIGSATVAGLTAAGIIAPLMPSLQTNASLMVLSIGAGSLFFSHVNDSGFWMFKEYFNLSIKDTIRSWSVMETIVSVAGLLGVFILQWLL